MHPEIEAHEVPLGERPVRCVHVGERRPVAHRDHGEEGLRALSQDFLLERQRPLALGDAGLEHAQHGRDAVLRDERGPLEATHLFRALHHARGPEERVGRLKRRPREPLRQPLPRGRKHPRLVHPDPPAQRPEIAQHLDQRVRRARRGRRRDLPHAGPDRSRRVRVVEEEVAVARDSIDLDAVRGHARRVDERNHESHALAGEHPVQLEAAEERVRDRPEPGQVLQIVRRARHQRIEPLGLQHRRQPCLHVLIHRFESPAR